MAHKILINQGVNGGLKFPTFSPSDIKFTHLFINSLKITGTYFLFLYTVSFSLSVCNFPFGINFRTLMENAKNKFLSQKPNLRFSAYLRTILINFRSAAPQICLNLE